MKKWAYRALLPLGGILTAVCLVFPYVGFLEWIALVPSLLVLFRASTQSGVRLRRLWGMGFLFFYGFYLVIYHWFLALYPMEFAGVSKGTALLLVLFCWLGLSLLQAFFSSLIFPLFGLLVRTPLLQKHPILTPFLFAAQWTVAEWSQTLTWAGVPWARLPLGQIEYGVIAGAASLFGSYIITFALVAVNGLVAYAVLHRAHVRFCGISAAATLGAVLIFGSIGYATANPEQGRPILAAAVQGNVGSSDKWTSDALKQSYEVYEKYTREAAEAGAEIVVFPETFIPQGISDKSSLGRYVKGLAQTYDITIVCGAFDYADTGDYNAAFTVLPDGTIHETVYAKRHLVPFGEYVPMRKFVEFVFPPLADIGMLAEDLQAGTDSAVVTLEQGRFGTMICFDSIYEELARDSVRDGAQFLILPTNDSWFTDSAAVYMHSRQARLRAIETGRWIVRSADTGISSVIAPTGRSYDEQPPLVEGMSMVTIHARDARTLYSYIGNAFVYLLIAALLGVGSCAGAIWLQKRCAHLEYQIGGDGL